MTATENTLSRLSAKGHFDGRQIVLDEPLELSEGAPLIVTSLPRMSDAERVEWSRLAAAALIATYVSREPASHLPEREPNRFLALLIGTAYIALVAQLCWQATDWPYLAILALTILGSLLVMAAFCLLGEKAYKKRNARIHFTFSTVFLASIPLSVYLAALRVLFRGLGGQQVNPFVWLIVSMFGLLAMIISSAILISFAEALVWLAVSTLRWQRKVLSHPAKH
ncbi:MAG TPA: hypothetical protein VGI40_23595 [Pirellulaceae bacterium]|jgi:hypothetical protein